MKEGAELLEKAKVRWCWCLVCGLVTSSQLEFGHVAKSQKTFGQNHQTPTYYG